MGSQAVVQFHVRWRFRFPQNRFHRQQSPTLVFALNPIEINMKIVCSICSLVLQDKKKICNHLKADHKFREDQNVLECSAEKCDRAYARFSSLSRHLDKCSFIEAIQSGINDLNAISENLTDNLVIDKESGHIENHTAEKTVLPTTITV